MSDIEYIEGVEKKVEAIRDKALQIVQLTHPEIKYVYDPRSIDDYCGKVWDYPGKWYSTGFTLPKGISSEHNLIQIIVRDTINYFCKH